MTITVLDTYPAMREILAAPQADRPELLRAMIEPAKGMYQYSGGSAPREPPEVHRPGSAGAALQHRSKLRPGEVDVVQMHAMGAGFPLDGDDERCRAGLAALHDADAWGRIARALDDAVAVQRAALPEVVVPDLVVLLTLGNPGDANLMGPSLGMTANGSVSGYLYLNVWPYPENLARLEATAVHELNHNLRYTTRPAFWDPATVTVGEHVVGEGLADAFARQLYGDELGRSRLSLATLGDDAVFEKVVSGLGTTGMQNFAAWVLGDEIAAHFGGTPVGVPTGAGYAAGNRLVDAYLAATGQTAAHALLAESAEVIKVGLA